MKIRQGFISNSSSSSFIVKRDGIFPDVFSVALSMVPLRDWDTDCETLRRIHESKRDRNTNICFKSCNHDTFILSTENYILVMTSNNHPFYKVFTNREREKIPEEIRELLKESTKEDDFDDFEDLDYKMYGFKYWYVDYGIDAYPVGYGIGVKSFCDKCCTDVVQLENGKIICPSCEINYVEPKINNFRCIDCGCYFEISQDTYDKNNAVFCPICKREIK